MESELNLKRRGEKKDAVKKELQKEEVVVEEKMRKGGI